MKYRPREDQKKSKKIVINVTEDDHKFIKLVAADNGVTITRLVLKALKFYLNKMKDNSTKN